MLLKTLFFPPIKTFTGRISFEIYSTPLLIVALKRQYLTESILIISTIYRIYDVKP